MGSRCLFLRPVGECQLVHNDTHLDCTHLDDTQLDNAQLDDAQLDDTHLDYALVDDTQLI